MSRIDFIETYSHSFIQEDTIVLAQATNKFLCKRAVELTDGDIENLWKYGLDIRLFSEAGEVKWFRPTIDMDFSKRERIADDKLVNEIDYLDEEQYLDIDTQKSSKEIVYATGGGKYTLPISKLEDAKVVIRNYLAYEEESGCVQIVDWRIVKFIEGRE